MTRKEVIAYIDRQLSDIDNAGLIPFERRYGEAIGAISMAERLGAVSLEEW